MNIHTSKQSENRNPKDEENAVPSKKESYRHVRHDEWKDSEYQGGDGRERSHDCRETLQCLIIIGAKGPSVGHTHFPPAYFLGLCAL